MGGLVNLAGAIATQEGYGPPGNIATRANNPGDLSTNNPNPSSYIVAGDGVHIAVYPDIQTGQAALESYLSGIANGTNPTYNAYAQSLGLPNSTYLTLAQVGAKYAGDPNWAAGVAKYASVSPNDSFAGIAGGTIPSDFTAVNYQSATPPGGSLVSQLQSLNRNAVAAQAVILQPATVDFNELFPDVIINTGLNEKPWYSDKDLVTGNPKVRGAVNPVVFEVRLKGNGDASFLEQSTSDTGPYKGSGNPIQVQLNASMKRFTTTMKHVFHPKRTRTGWHITFWGMQADTIEGSCTTGVFMNQLGITDLFSVSSPSSDLITLLTSGFKTMAFGTGKFPVYTNAQGQQTAAVTEYVDEYIPNGSSDRVRNTTDVFEAYGQGGQQAADVLSAVSQQGTNQTVGFLSGLIGHDPSKAFRVAAQDAFVEFLHLFKNNGVVWINNQNGVWGASTSQTGAGSQGAQAMEQVGVDEWSPAAAMSATAHNARNNDVMTRGNIVMKFKGTTYLGYFKSLSWQQDAVNPYQWAFNFSFQVERTYGYVFSPVGASYVPAPPPGV